MSATTPLLPLVFARSRDWLFRWFPLLSRIVAATLGAYVLMLMFGVALLVLPVSGPESLLWGAQLGFLVYAGAVVWVFAVRSATRAWVGLLIAALVLLPFVLWVRMGAAA